ncbi:MAG: terminase gpA endonuclease subunit [Smithella sp.]
MQPSSVQTFTFTDGERRVFRIPERISTADWAEKYRMVVDGGRKSPWRNELSPCAVGIMDALDQPFIREIYVQAAPQTVKTQPFINYLMKRIDQAPTSAMVAMPDEKLTRRFFRRRLITSIKDTPQSAAVLSHIVGDITRTSIAFTNGMDITGAWAGSSASMASDAMEVVILDEANKYPDPQGDEPNGIDAGRQRTNSFPFTYKLYASSSATNEKGQLSQTIKKRADETRYYYAKCPICGEEQRMIWDNISWGNTRDPRKVLREKLARYNCKACGMQWDDSLRDRAVLATMKTGWRAEPEWQCTKCDWTGSETELNKGTVCPTCGEEIAVKPPLKRPRAVAFKLASWYVLSMSEAVAAFLEGQDDPEKLKTWVTQHCNEEWVEKAIKKTENAVLQRQSIYPALIVPPDALALTCAIDVQKRGFWYSVRAWAEDLTSWLIQYEYITTWTEVETLIYQAEYKVYDSQNTMKIWRAGIDTGGGETEKTDGIDPEWSRTEEIYQWLRRQPMGAAQRVFGIKGATHIRSLAAKRIKISRIDTFPSSNKPIPGGLELRLLDTSQFKGLIHFRLGKKDKGEDGKPETQRFYVHHGTGIDYVKQLLAEEYRQGKGKKWEWKVVYHGGNHLLDCEVIHAALADPEWFPSLQMMASSIKRNNQLTEQRPREDKDSRHNVQEERQNFERPKWLNR